MNRNKRRKSKTEKGITLVALVVTIIILLILAGVTLNLVLSNNGLITKSKQGVAKYQEASQNEQVDLDLMGDLIDEASGVKKITVGGSTIQVTPGVESLKEHYGEEVTSFSSVEGETKYKAWFATWDGSSYKGPIVETGEWSKGTASNTITGNPLTSKYLRWVGSSVNTVANYPNMKAVAYMMDTNKWSDFAGSTSGVTAMGGATLEMFIKSYNAKHDTKISTYEDENGNSTISSTNANSYGYKVKWENGTSWSDSISGLDRSTDNMWIKTSTDRAYAMWMASPSSYYNGVRYVSYSGILDDYSVIGTYYGFRPVVSIPKS